MSTIQIYNTLTRSKETLEPRVPGKVGMYVCGPTVYDFIHIGNARTFTTFDMVSRWLRATGYDVKYVRNITDIDDKIIERARERGVAFAELAESMARNFRADCDRLSLIPPDSEPRATRYIEPMLGLVDTLEKKGLAYRADNGDVYFSVRDLDGYGKLSRRNLDDLRAGERVAVAEAKKDPLDFVLWKASKPSEPADAKWDSVYGPGRPGWHIECSAMCKALLGEHFDIHGGGIDLQFPHHENEIAQSEAANGGPFVNYWLHNGHLTVDDEKMSKSLGNFFTIRDVLKRYDGETLRFFMLRSHYRSPVNFSDSNLDDARSALRRLYTALEGVEFPPGDLDWQAPGPAAFRAAMNDDFNTPLAIASLFDLASDVNRTRAGDLGAQLKQLGGALGLLQQSPRAYLQGGSGLDADAIEERIEARARAKQSRDFALADRIRAELAEAGIVLQDSASGTTWMKA